MLYPPIKVTEATDKMWSLHLLINDVHKNIRRDYPNIP